MKSQLLASTIMGVFLIASPSQARDAATVKNRLSIDAGNPFLFLMQSKAAQDTYKINIKPTLDEGQAYLYKSTESKKTAVKTVDGDGKTILDTTQTSGMASERRVTILKWAEEDLPAAGHVRYDRAVTIKDGVEHVSALQGKKVRIEKNGDDFQLRADNGNNLTEEQLADFDLRHFQNTTALSIIADPGVFPKKGVVLNEVWTLDPALFGNGSIAASHVFDLEQCVFRAKLVRVYQKQGRQYGTVEFNFVLPLKQMPLDENIQLLDGKLVYRAIFDGCIDGSMAAGKLSSVEHFEMKVLEEALGIQATTDLQVIHTNEASHEEVAK